MVITIGNHDRRDVFLDVFAGCPTDENGFVQQAIDLPNIYARGEDYYGEVTKLTPEILSALQPAQRIEALMPARDRIARFPLWQAAA